MNKKNLEHLIDIAGIIAEFGPRAIGLFTLATNCVAVWGILYLYANNHVLLSFCLFCIFLVIISNFLTFVVVKRINDKRDRSVAQAFALVTNDYMIFEKEIMNMIHAVSLQENATLNLNFRPLLDAHKKYLQNICDTAVHVFGAKKGVNNAVYCNIKRIDVSKEKNIITYKYKPLSRSTNTEPARIDYDRRLEASPLKIDDNYMYRKIFDKSYVDDFYFHHDLEKLMEEFRNNKENAIEPNMTSLGFYRSFLIYPINGEDASFSSITEIETIEPLLKYNDTEVFGLMCVDSPRKLRFNRDYDLHLMREMTDFAFSSFRLVRALKQLAMHKKKTLVSKVHATNINQSN